MTPIKPYTGERLELQAETWRLRYVEHQGTTEIAKAQNRCSQSVRNDTADYGDRRTFEGRAAAEAACCERCGIIREAGRLPNSGNWNAAVLCDDCHEELVAGTFYTDELLPERLRALGYDPGDRLVLRLGYVHNTQDVL